ncbi:MAG: hypothetical protein JXA54_02300 [Candidatus Heimdallarchaeota archaeon]|nr:hypothetical protein [Candidatus Heimdallarchaeota archaeon]
MVDFSPDLPWLYLVIFAGFMAFVLVFGLTLALTQSKKKKKKLQEEQQKEETST